MTKGTPATITDTDPLRRLTLTPFAEDVRAMGRTVRIETNDPDILNCFIKLFERYRATRSAKAEFLWSVVSETQHAPEEAWPKMRAFSERGLRYVNLGHRNVFAVEAESCEAVAFVSRRLSHDAVGFPSVFVATLFDMTAGALGLTLIPAACISSNRRALLIFGPPRSGKTTSAHWAGRSASNFNPTRLLIWIWKVTASRYGDSFGRQRSVPKRAISYRSTQRVRTPSLTAR